MSHRLISRSLDLKRLRDEGYDVAIVADHLVVRDVPYVNSAREIKRGILISTLKLAGDVTDAPDGHVVLFAGEQPCNTDGLEIAQIKHQTGRNELGNGLVADRSFSNRPKAGYSDYHAKMTRYVDIISAPARAIDDAVTARTYPVVDCLDGESVFMYMDTASSRAEIGAATEKLKIGRVAIIGLGGTGSYVLDLIAKTPVAEIHLFDGDGFSQHNAFRSPGAPSVDELRQRPAKVAYFRERYSPMRRHIVAHEYNVDASNVAELQGMEFVFICVDRTAVKKVIMGKLEELGTPFIDVGLGVQLVQNSLAGLVRTTTSTAKKRGPARAQSSEGDGDGNNEYQTNIQVAELNALSASLAVIRWKKLCGFYVDQESEHSSLYMIGGNELINEDRA